MSAITDSGVEAQNHQVLVEISPVDEQASRFGAICDEAEVPVERDGGCIFGDDAEMHLLHPRAGVGEDVFDQCTSDAAATGFGPDEDAPDVAAMRVLRPGAPHE